MSEGAYVQLVEDGNTPLKEPVSDLLGHGKSTEGGS